MDSANKRNIILWKVYGDLWRVPVFFGVGAILGANSETPLFESLLPLQVALTSCFKNSSYYVLGLTYG